MTKKIPPVLMEKVRKVPVLVLMLALVLVLVLSLPGALARASELVEAASVKEYSTVVDTMVKFAQQAAQQKNQGQHATATRRARWKLPSNVLWTSCREGQKHFEYGKVPLQHSPL